MFLKLLFAVSFSDLYIYIYIYVLPLRSVGRSNFDKGRHNLTTLINKTDIY